MCNSTPCGCQTPCGGTCSGSSALITGTGTAGSTGSGSVPISGTVPIGLPQPDLPTSTSPCGDGVTASECIIVSAPILVDGKVLIPAGKSLQDVIKTLTEYVNKAIIHISPDSKGVSGTGTKEDPLKITVPLEAVKTNPLTTGTGGGLDISWTPDSVKPILDAIKNSAELSKLFCALDKGCEQTTDTSVLCADPINLTAGGITVSNGTLYWQNRDGITPLSYTLQYKLRSASEYTDLGELVVTDTTVAPAYTLSQLLPNTTYDWRVRRNCSAKLSSAWVSSQFTTKSRTPVEEACGAATNLTVKF